MKMYFYETEEVDDDGDRYDWGFVEAGNAATAQRRIRTRLENLFGGRKESKMPAFILRVKMYETNSEPDADGTLGVQQKSLFTWESKT